MHLRHLNRNIIDLSNIHRYSLILKTFKANLSTSTHLRAKALPPRPTLPATEIKHTYLKGSGPGGQKINKTSSAVQLTHLPSGIVVKSQATRSRSQNHNIARRILAEKIEFLDKGADSRAAKVIEVKRRKKASGEKKRRRKYKLLDGKREDAAEADGYGFGVDGKNAWDGAGPRKGLIKDEKQFCQKTSKASI